MCQCNVTFLLCLSAVVALYFVYKPRLSFAFTPPFSTIHTHRGAFLVFTSIYLTEIKNLNVLFAKYVVNYNAQNERCQHQVRSVRPQSDYICEITVGFKSVIASCNNGMPTKLIYAKTYKTQYTSTGPQGPQTSRPWVCNRIVAPSTRHRGTKTHTPCKTAKF